MNSNTYIEVGTIGAPHGVRGWLKVHSDFDPITALLDCETWILTKDGNRQHYRLLAGKAHGKGLIVHLEGMQSPEQAKALTHSKVSVERQALPVLTENEFYHEDLTGLTVIDTEQTVIGTVVDIMTTNANDILVVRTQDGDKHLIPLVFGQIVLQVSLDEKIIRVDWDTTAIIAKPSS